jgi:hypothetical protein
MKLKEGKMKVFKNKYYITRNHPGISGFKQWDKWEFRVITGFNAQKHKTDVIYQFFANGKGIFRLEDGHLSPYQPVVQEKEIYDFLDKNPYQSAYILTPEIYGLGVNQPSKREE